ncbi:MAG: DUF6614 family protein [Pseudomonadota bacterium]
MHTTFDLRDGIDIASFQTAWDDFIVFLRAHDLVAGSSAIAKRRDDTPLDTDSARRHRYFVIMSFCDRAQSEAAWDMIAPRAAPSEQLHSSVLRMVDDPIFACWEDDVQSPPDL